MKQREKSEPRIILKQFTQKYLNRKFIPIIIINHKIRDVTYTFIVRPFFKNNRII